MIQEKNNQLEEQSEDVVLLDGALFSKMASSGAAELRINADEVNSLNVFPVPDGDTGDNMCMTIESGVAALQGLHTDDLATVMSALSHGMLLGARGNSGVILSQFFSGMAKGLEDCEKADVNTIAQALQLGVKKAYESVLTPTEGTILTVARESVEYAVNNLKPDSTVNKLFSDLFKEMYASLQRTPEMLAVLKEAKVVDSGGAGLFHIVEGFNKALNGQETVIEQMVQPHAQPATSLSGFNADSVMTYGYCTEFLLQLQNCKVSPKDFDVATITAFLQTIGDSIVAFKVDDIVKVHVHTMMPEEVLGFCRKFGEFLTIKIENMSVQHNETIQPQKEQPKKKYATVAVCNGPGIQAAFEELGVDAIVEGGQTNNPSTQDFLDAFARVSADHVFVFPNNGNIIMAAKQAAEIYTDAQVHVIESKDLGAGYVGLAAVNPEAASEQEILDQTAAAMQNVTTAYVSPAVRDAEINGVSIVKDEFIGVMAKQILVSEPKRLDAVCRTVDHLLSGGDAFMLTVFCGVDADEAEKQALQQYCADNYKDVELYLIDGKQEIYPYIMLAEA